MKTVSYPLRIPNAIMYLAKMRAREEHLDQSTALRQLLHIGAEEYLINLVSQGRITVHRAAELSNTTIYDIYRIAEKHGIKLGATEEQRKKSEETAERLIKKLKSESNTK